MKSPYSFALLFSLALAVVGAAASNPGLAAPFSGYEPRLPAGEYQLTLSHSEPGLADVLKGTVGVTVTRELATADYAGTVDLMIPKLSADLVHGHYSISPWAAPGNQYIHFEIGGLDYSGVISGGQHAFAGTVARDGRELATFRLEPVPAPVPAPLPDDSYNDCIHRCGPGFHCLITCGGGW